jgi:RNA polymerase sigma-70 factor, ECF subfamily
MDEKARDISGGRSIADGIPDADVVGRVLDGDVALFEILMRRYNQRLYRVARAILGDEAEAEEVMQQAYVNAYLHLDQFAARASFSTWLTRIAVHEALARSRRRKRTGELHAVRPAGEDPLSHVPAGAPDPERRAFVAELRSLLEYAVDGLPEPHRVVFTLREIEGLTTFETAEALSISEANVKTRLHRARVMLREALYARTGITSCSAFQLDLSRCDRVVAGVLQRIDLLNPVGA